MLEAPRITLVGLNEQARPVDGEGIVASVTVPVKPCRAGRAVTVIVDVAITPGLTVTLVVVATTVKS
jgi:hypothetical protein